MKKLIRTCIERGCGTKYEHGYTGSYCRDCYNRRNREKRRRESKVIKPTKGIDAELFYQVATSLPMTIRKQDGDPPLQA